MPKAFAASRGVFGVRLNALLGLSGNVITGQVLQVDGIIVITFHQLKECLKQTIPRFFAHLQIWRVALKRINVSLRGVANRRYDETEVW